MELQNLHQTKFFEKAIPFEVLENTKVDNKENFRHLLILSNHKRSLALSDFQKEISANLLLMKKTKTRVSYLRRIILEIDNHENHLRGRLELLTENKKDYEYHYSHPNEGTIHFSVPLDYITNHLKAALTYIQLLRAFLNQQLNIEDQQFSSSDVSSTELVYSKLPKIKWSVDKKQCYDVFKELYNSKWISNTKEELKDFIYGFIEFAHGKHPTKSTISAELKRKTRPIKSKCFKLPGSNAK